MRETQKSRCYNWEDAVIYFTAANDPNCKWTVTADRAEMMSIFESLKVAFKIPEPFKLVFDDNPKLRVSCARYFHEDIILCQHHSNNVGILCHEFAHVIVAFIVSKCPKIQYKISPHGAEWLTIYMMLLNRVHGVPVDLMISTAEVYKLKLYPEVLQRYENPKKV